MVKPKLKERADPGVGAERRRSRLWRWATCVGRMNEPSEVVDAQACDVSVLTRPVMAGSQRFRRSAPGYVISHRDPQEQERIVSDHRGEGIRGPRLLDP